MPEQNDKKRPEPQLNVSDFGAGHGRPPEDRRVAGLMHWVRIILPMMIAAFGWYVGHIIGNFTEDVRALETKVQTNEVACMTRAGEVGVQIAELRRDIDAADEQRRRDHQNDISKDEYLRNLTDLRNRITDLERSMYQNRQK